MAKEVSDRERKFITIVRNIIIFIILLTIVIICAILMNPPKHSTNKYIENYTRWKSCMDNSDSTNTDCQECDSLFNPNNEFQY